MICLKTVPSITTTHAALRLESTIATIRPRLPEGARICYTMKGVRVLPGFQGPTDEFEEGLALLALVGGSVGAAQQYVPQPVTSPEILVALGCSVVKTLAAIQVRPAIVVLR